MEQVILSKEQIHDFQNQRIDLYNIIQTLEPTTHPTIIKKLNDVYEFLVKMTADFDQAEDEAEANEVEALEKIREENDFHTIWSMDIKSSELNNKMPKKVKCVIYGQYNIPVGKEITWLEFWKIANQIIDKNSDHIFIEDAVYKGDNHVHLTTGS